MKLIVGLGNPGDKYTYTRHNTGFLVIDEIAKKLDIDVTKKDFNALIGKREYKGQQVILMKPQTYMNESGIAVRAIVNYYHLDMTKDVIIIYDDLDLNYGKLRLRETGSAGGHNGIKSIISQTGTDKFCRIRVGIEKNPIIPVVDYVLGKVEKEKLPLYQKSLERAANASVEALTDSFQKVMNKYNKNIDEETN